MSGFRPSVTFESPPTITCKPYRYPPSPPNTSSDTVLLLRLLHSVAQFLSFVYARSVCLTWLASRKDVWHGIVTIGAPIRVSL